MPIENVMYMTYDITIPSGTATTQRPESCDGRAEDESDIPSISSLTLWTSRTAKRSAPASAPPPSEAKSHPNDHEPAAPAL